MGSVSLDLTTLASRYRSGQACPHDVIARLDAGADPTVWIHRLPADLLEAQARNLDKRRAAGEAMPLFGVPFAVKDNIDVAHHPTTAACPAYAYTPKRHAPVVENLLRAGAIVVGKTNMDQFASGLAGDRSPYGACRNAFDRDYVSGGSSSGSAVAVARGWVSFALGTDTAGSGRVPAGCNNIVGLKPTPGTLSNVGLVPACPSLDCVSVLALTAADAWQVYAAATGSTTSNAIEDGTVDEALGPQWTFAVPREEDREFFGDDAQRELYSTVLERLREMGGRPVAIDFRPFRDLALLLYEGPWLAQRLAAVEPFLKQHADAVYPVTRSVLQGGARYGAADVFHGLTRLEKLRGQCVGIFDEADVLVVPTMPTVPRLADVQADSLRWSRRLGYYTNYVNLLRWAAIAVPAGFTPEGLPGSITFIGPGGSDRQLCRLGMAWQRALGLRLGATEWTLPPTSPRGEQSPSPPLEDHIRVAVAGAHLRGRPLHGALRRCGALFVRACRTAPCYRFVALMHLDPPRPGLVRDDARAGSVAVEIYDMPVERFGRLVASVAPPLAIGTIELADGEAVKGFLCEPHAAAGATDITDFGSWIAFRGGGDT